MSKHLKHYESIRQLRSEGLTYQEINKKLGLHISRSSLNYICSGIVLSQAQRDKIEASLQAALVQSRKKALESNRRIQEARRADIRKKNLKYRQLNDKEAKVALALLYLGEGAKRESHRGICLGSSNPEIISIFIGLMNRCYGIKPNEFKCRISYRADQDLNELEDFWSKHTKIPRDNFYKTKPDPRTKDKPTLRTNYKGVCVLSRKGTDIQLELQIIADIIFENMGT